jgi:diacylglycerol kinase family enzyme
VIGIDGGDGTLHKTVATLIDEWGDTPLPPVAILAGGTMNVVSASLGIKVSPERLLSALAEDVPAGRPLATVSRRCLRIDGTYGFIFGNGLMANFLEDYYADQGYGPGRAVYMLGRTFLSALGRTPYAQKMFRPFAGRLRVDDEDLPWRSLTGVGAATVREVGLGFKLNHRADDDPDRFGVLAIHAPPLALARDLWAVHEGRGVGADRAWSGLATRMVIEADDPEFAYTIDGDLYRHRTAAGPLVIEIGPRLDFIQPR